jgi:hydroxyacylglutathione hydrolase
MQEIFDYGHGISAVDALYDGHPTQTAVHIVIERGRAAIIDTGTSHAAERVLAALAARGVPPEAVDYVILSHVHLDHAGGAGQLMARCPNAVLAVHPRGRRHMEDPGRLMAATVAIYGEQATRRVYGEVLPVPSARVVEMHEASVLKLAGREFLCLDAPGHARHHVVLHDSTTGHIFAGDTFGLSYRALDRDGLQFVFPTTSPSQFDPAALHRSIDRMLALRPEAIYVTHFGRLAEPQRLSADLHRLIDAHAEMALHLREPGPQRHARLAAGVRKIVLDEAVRQRWFLTKEEVIAIFEFDIELNAQGLAAWLDSLSARPERDADNAQGATHS